MKKLEHLLTIIDVDWIKDYPDTAFELIECLISEYYDMKDYIESQREKMLLSAVMIESLKQKISDLEDASNKQNSNKRETSEIQKRVS